MRSPITRRRICASACRAVSMLAAASVSAGCDGGTTAPSLPVDPGPTPPPAPADLDPPPTSSTVVPLPAVAAALVNGGLSVNLDGSPLVEPWGSAIAEVVRDGVHRFFLLTNIGTGAFTALDGVCTHQGCLVSRVARPVFVCPCHGSRYDHNGNVVQGPAAAALVRFPTEQANGTLTVRF